jgi:hypothetical protein
MKRLMSLYCIASAVFIFAIALFIQGAFAALMLEAPWFHLLAAQTTLFIGPILLFVGGLEGAIPRMRRTRRLLVAACGLLLFYLVGLAWIGFGQIRFVSAYALVLSTSLLISAAFRTPKTVTAIGAGILSALFLIGGYLLSSRILNEASSLPNIPVMATLLVGAVLSICALILGLLPSKQET